MLYLPKYEMIPFVEAKIHKKYKNFKSQRQHTLAGICVTLNCPCATFCKVWQICVIWWGSISHLPNSLAFFWLSPLSAYGGYAMLWWQWSDLTWRSCGRLFEMQLWTLGLHKMHRISWLAIGGLCKMSILLRVTYFNKSELSLTSDHFGLLPYVAWVVLQKCCVIFSVNSLIWHE